MNLNAQFLDDRNKLGVYVYLERLLARQRVLEIGCGGGQGLAWLRAAGAQASGLDRPGNADAGGARITPWQPPHLPFDQSAFDRVLVPDLRFLEAHRCPLEEVVRVLRPDGMAILCVPSGDHPENVDGMSYGDLLDLIEPHFDAIRIIGQSPFVGYSLVELSDTPPAELEVELDASLMGGAVEEVGTYIALCAHHEKAHTLPYSVIQVPSDEALVTGAEVSDTDDDDAVVIDEDHTRATSRDTYAADRIAADLDRTARQDPTWPAEGRPGPAPTPSPLPTRDAPPRAPASDRSSAADLGTTPSRAPAGERDGAGDPGTPPENPPATTPSDTARYTDQAGGQVDRWRWPEQS